MGWNGNVCGEPSTGSDMRLLFHRISSSLQNRLRSWPRISRTGLNGKTSAPRIPALSASFVAISFLAPTAKPHPSCEERWGWMSRLNTGNPKETLSLSASDVPQLITETFRGIYHRTKHGIATQLDTEGGTSVIYITAANIAVYLLWKGAPSSFMYRYDHSKNPQRGSTENLLRDDHNS